jgi:hypothetical protein
MAKLAVSVIRFALVVDFPAVQAVNRRDQDSLDLLRSYFYFVAHAGPLFPQPYSLASFGSHSVTRA